MFVNGYITGNNINLLEGKNNTKQGIKNKIKTNIQKIKKKIIIIIIEGIKYLYIKYSWKKIIQKQKKKFHLMKNPSQSIITTKNKDIQIQTNINMKLNLELFSYKILENKYNSTPELYHL